MRVLDYLNMVLSYLNVKFHVRHILPLNPLKVTLSRWYMEDKSPLGDLGVVQIKVETEFVLTPQPPERGSLYTFLLSPFQGNRGSIANAKFLSIQQWDLGVIQIKKKLKLSLIIILALICISQSIFSQQTTNCWPVFRGDNQFQGITSCKLPESFSLKWIYKTKEQIKSSLILCQDKIFIATSQGLIVCLNKEGKEIWKVIKESSFEASPIFLENTIYIGSLEGKFYSINASTGNVNWVYNVGNQIIGSANWFKYEKKTNIVFGCYDNKIYCLNSMDGKLNWTYETENYINGAPAISDKQIVFGGCDSYLHVIGAEKGELIKKIELGTYIASSASIVENKAYLGNYDGEFMSVDLAKGNLYWNITLNQDASVISSPSVINNKIIIGARDQRVHCLETKSGKKLWSFKTQGFVDASPIVDEKRVLVCSNDGRVYILDINTGKEIFSFDLGSTISSTPAVVEGLIVIAADNGNIYGFKF